MNPKKILVILITSLLVMVATGWAQSIPNPLGTTQSPVVEEKATPIEPTPPPQGEEGNRYQQRMAPRGPVSPDQYFRERPDRMGFQKPTIQRVSVYYPPTQPQLDTLARQRTESLVNNNPEFAHSGQALVNLGKARRDKDGKVRINPVATQSDLELADRRLPVVLQKVIRENRQNISINRTAIVRHEGILSHFSKALRANRWWLWILSALLGLVLLDYLLFLATGRGLFSRLRRGYA